MKPHLKQENDYRRIRSRCLPLFDLAKGRDPGHQSNIYRTMAMLIADALDVQTRWQDMVVELPDAEVHIMPDVSGIQNALDALRFIQGSRIEEASTSDEPYRPQITYDRDMWGFDVSPTFAGGSERGPEHGIAA